MVLWRFTGDRTVSATAERHAQRGVAVSFWLTAPYVAAESIHHLADAQRVETSVIGIVLTSVALVAMPMLGRANHKLGARLRSGQPRAAAPRTTFARRRLRGLAHSRAHCALVRRLVGRSRDRVGHCVCRRMAGCSSLARPRLLLGVA